MRIAEDLQTLARFIMALCVHWNEQHAKATGLAFQVTNQEPIDYQI